MPTPGGKRRRKILILGIIARQARLIEQAAGALPRDVQLIFQDCGNRDTAPSSLTHIDVVVETRFVPHKWHNVALRDCGAKRIRTCHGGLKQIAAAVREAAQEVPA